MNKITIAALIALSLVAVSCKDTVAPVAVPLTKAQEKMAETLKHAEIHFSKGDFVTVTGEQESVNEEHICYKVVSTKSTGTLKYKVTLEAGEKEADRILFLDKLGVTVAIKDSTGKKADSHAADFTGVSSAIIKQGFEIHELTAGTYTIELGNLTPNDTLKMLIEHGGHDHAK